MKIPAAIRSRERPSDIVPSLEWHREDYESGFRAWAEPNPAGHPEPCWLHQRIHG